jgi:hypothetical protein
MQLNRSMSPTTNELEEALATSSIVESTLTYFYLHIGTKF